MARRPFKTEVNDWLKGVIVADYASDKVPDNAASRARNTAWIKNGYPAKRKGMPIVNLSAQAGLSPILGLGNFSGFNWTISKDGKWSKMTGTQGTTAALGPIDAGNASPFTAGLTTYPSVATAKNLLFAVNGTDAVKTDGITVSKFGIVAPGAPTLVDSGVAGNPSGTFLGAITAYNKNTGHESSLSANVSVTVVGKKLTMSWSFPADTQVTHVRAHIFKNSLTDRFFRLSSTDVTPAPDVTTGGYDSGTTSITINVTDADINNLIVQSPTTTENNPPPTGTKAIFFHGSRMFATDGNYLFYSKPDDPESFDPNNYEPVNTNDNQKIVAMVTLSDQHLIILKDRSSYMLIGPDDPNTWEVQELDITVGCISPRSIVAVEGALWWEALQGLMRIKYTGAYTIPTLQRMDSPNMSDRLENLNESQLGTTCGGYDTIRQRILFAVPDAFQTVNNLILPYNNRLSLFEDVWDPIEVSAMGTFIDSGEPYVALGSYQGRVFRLWQEPYLDGVRQVKDDAVTLTTLAGTVTAATSTSLTDSGAVFDNEHDGLRDISVVAVSPDGSFTERNYISSNTGTQLTLKYSWTQTPVAGWTYVVGSPYFEFDTKHFHPTGVPEKDGSEFYTRNFKHLLVKASTDTTSTSLTAQLMIDGNVAAFAKTVMLAITSGGGQFDIDKFDMASFGTGAAAVKHVMLGLHGHTCGVRFRNYTPGDGVIMLSMGLYGTELSFKA